MKRSDVQRMDVNLLYSIVNMKLRNDYADLDDLVRSMDIDRAELETRLGEAGYLYSADVKQFRKLD
ncbi:MAG TPA: DUF4250 domain-containing protein [Gammaproteobacteria bacterium]